MELARRLEGQAPIDFPQETALGALALYVSNETVEHFQPMNINFGIMPPLGYRVKGKRNKNAAPVPAVPGDPGGVGRTWNKKEGVPMRIIVDAMGGDNAPQALVEGALRAVRELGVEVHAHRPAGGDRGPAWPSWATPPPPPGVEIAPASQVIEMEDNPATGL